MIKGLFETHIFVRSLERSIDFYRNIMGLELCHVETERKVAFFWIGSPRKAMLGIWESDNDKIEKRHFAFECNADDVLNKATNFLKERNIKARNFLRNETEQPMVFAWMPAVAIYFDDPDGHELELIGILDGEGKPKLGVLSYEQWIEQTLP
jgi:catechol 2,3-dioxygenase-like lactoylglutathione lyase family enzyme